jgi:undecaprenyl-diphosphatase
MNIYLLFVAFVLGVVQGATEFLPVSSTGHLILVSDWMGFTGEKANTFAVFIQLGAILAILWLYRATFADVLSSWRRDAASRRFLLNVAIATLPAVVVGFLAYDWIMEYLFSPLTVAGALLVGGILILLIEAWQPRTTVNHVGRMPLSMALGVGLAQVLALFPGVSRSGATILGGYGLGLSRTAATEFSFFLAIPVMLGATAFELSGRWVALTPADLWMLSVGFVVSFVSALVVVKGFLRFVSRHTFRAFAWYRIALGLLLLLYYAGRGWAESPSASRSACSPTCAHPGRTRRSWPRRTRG